VFALLFLLCGCEKTEQTQTADTSNYSRVYGDFEIFQRDGNVEIEKNGVLVGMIENMKFTIADESRDGSAIAFSVYPAGTDDSASDFKGYSLYYCKDELIHIADKAANPTISDNGEIVAYHLNLDVGAFLSDEADIEEMECDLYLWHGGESTFIKTKKFYEAFLLSPDGKDLYYETGKEKLLDNGDWYFYNNGNPVLVMENVRLIVVTNNSEYLYAEGEDSFFVQKGLNGEKCVLAVPDEDNRLHINTAYNADYTKLMLNTPEGLFIVENGEPVRISDSVDTLLAPEPEGKYFTYPDFEDMPGQVFLTDSGELCKIGEDYMVIELDEDVTQAYLANDGETVIYTIEENRYDLYNEVCIARLFINSTTEPDILVKTLDTYLSEFEISDDGKNVFYAIRINDKDGTSLYVFKNGEHILIDSGIESGDGVVFNNDKYYYFKNEGKILYCYDGEKIAEVKKFSHEIRWISDSPYGVYYDRLDVGTSDNRDYISYDGIEFTRESD
jgi:hypothetical protein